MRASGLMSKRIGDWSSLPMNATGTIGAHERKACSGGRPVLVPGDGSQLVSLTHAADNAAMIAAALGNSKAVGQIFNCGTTNFITCVAVHAAAHAAAASAAPGRCQVL